MSEIVLKPVIPILFVKDVPASAAFFREKLGFEIDFLYGTSPFYGSVSRGEACFHLRFVHRPNFTELASCEISLILATVEVSDVHALFEEFEGRGVEFAQVADGRAVARGPRRRLGTSREPWTDECFQVRG